MGSAGGMYVSPRCVNRSTAGYPWMATSWAVHGPPALVMACLPSGIGTGLKVSPGLRKGQDRDQSRFSEI